MHTYLGKFTITNALGGGYGGTHSEEMEYQSSNRAGSKANADDAIQTWKMRHGKSGSVALESAYLVKD